MLVHPPQYTVCTPSRSAPCNYLAVKNALMQVCHWKSIFGEVSYPFWYQRCQSMFPTKKLCSAARGVQFLERSAKQRNHLA